MGQYLHRLKKRKKAYQRLSGLFGSPESVLVVHYSCESFYERPEGRTPRVTSIAVRNLGSGQTYSFSIHKVAEQKAIAFNDIPAQYDRLEKAMLDEYFEFIRPHQHFTWVHWNMRDVNYGFQAIEHRYRVLGGEPIEIQEDRKFDLARELIAIFGVGYIGHPRLENLVKKNKITDRDFLTGAEEAAAFDNRDYVRLHQSTLRKVDIMSNVAERAADRSLKTNATWLEIYGTHPAAAIEFIREHWVYSLLGFVGLVFSLLKGLQIFF